MLRSKRNDKPVLLNLDVRVLEEVDLAVREARGLALTFFCDGPSSEIYDTTKSSSGPSSLAFYHRVKAGTGSAMTRGR